MEERWWGGPLNTEALAWASVSTARAAAQTLAERRGQNLALETSPELVSAAFAAIDHLRVQGRTAGSWGLFSGFFRTEDGWVRTHGNYPHHERALKKAFDAASWEDLALRLEQSAMADAEQRILDAGGIGVAVRTPADWRNHPQNLATEGDSWVSIQESGSRRELSGGSLPLDGVKVLDLTRVIAGPACTQLLACLGAEVLRVDPPARPEILDQYLSNGMGKRSAVLDFGQNPEAVPGLVKWADVVVLGYRPGSLSRWGLDPEQLLFHKPSLVVGSLSAWGEQGPWGCRPGFDSIVQAATGISSMCGTALKPGALPVQALDHSTGYMLAAGIMRLLAEGQSGVVRASLLGAARSLMELPLPGASAPATSSEPPSGLHGFSVRKTRGRASCPHRGGADDGASN